MSQLGTFPGGRDLSPNFRVCEEPPCTPTVLSGSEPCGPGHYDGPLDSSTPTAHLFTRPCGLYCGHCSRCWRDNGEQGGRKGVLKSSASQQGELPPPSTILSCVAWHSEWERNSWGRGEGVWGVTILERPGKVICEHGPEGGRGGGGLVAQAEEGGGWGRERAGSPGRTKA